MIGPCMDYNSISIKPIIKRHLELQREVTLIEFAPSLYFFALSICLASMNIILKWMKLLQTPHPLGFNDNIYHEGNISSLPDFIVFSLLDICKRNNRSHGKRKNRNLKRKNKHVLTLSELSII